MYLEQKIFTQVHLNRPAVILLHAFPVNHHMWEPQMNFLTAQGIPYLTLDYPGFGDSSPFAEPPAMADFAAVVVATIKETKIPRAVFIGLSMGGYVALAVYRQAPELFAGLVLADTRATADSPEGKQRRFQLMQQIEQTGDLQPLIESHVEKFFTIRSRKNKLLVSRARRFMERATTIGVRHALHAMAHRPDSTELLSQMDFPVEVIVGEDDQLTTVDDAAAMVEQLPRGHLTIIPQAAHLTNMEQPQAFNAALASYFKRIGIF